MKRLSLSAIVVLSLAAPALAQEPKARDPTGRRGVSQSDLRRRLLSGVRRRAARAGRLQRLRHYARLFQRHGATLRPRRSPVHSGRAADHRRQPRQKPRVAPGIRLARRTGDRQRRDHVRPARDALAHVRGVAQSIPCARPPVCGAPGIDSRGDRPRREHQGDRCPHAGARGCLQRRGLWTRRNRQVQEHRWPRDVPPVRRRQRAGQGDASQGSTSTAGTPGIDRATWRS